MAQMIRHRSAFGANLFLTQSQWEQALALPASGSGLSSDEDLGIEGPEADLDSLDEAMVATEGVMELLASGSDLVPEWPEFTFGLARAPRKPWTIHALGEPGSFKLKCGRAASSDHRALFQWPALPRPLRKTCFLVGM